MRMLLLSDGWLTNFLFDQKLSPTVLDTQHTWAVRFNVCELLQQFWHMLCQQIALVKAFVTFGRYISILLHG